jgi:hypothetical protein
MFSRLQSNEGECAPDGLTGDRTSIPISSGGVICLRRAGTLDRERTITIWRSAVDATHHFFDPGRQSRD